MSRQKKGFLNSVLEDVSTKTSLADVHKLFVRHLVQLKDPHEYRSVMRHCMKYMFSDSGGLDTATLKYILMCMGEFIESLSDKDVSIGIELNILSDITVNKLQHIDGWYTWIKNMKGVPKLIDCNLSVEEKDRLMLFVKHSIKNHTRTEFSKYDIKKNSQDFANGVLLMLLENVKDYGVKEIKRSLDVLMKFDKPVRPVSHFLTQEKYFGLRWEIINKLLLTANKPKKDTTTKYDACLFKDDWPEASIYLHCTKYIGYDDDKIIYDGTYETFMEPLQKYLDGEMMFIKKQFNALTQQVT